MIGELPDSKGYNTILVVVDCLSKWIHTIPTVTSLDSTGVAQLFLEHVWHHHRLLEEVIRNHGPAFISNFSHKLAALLGVKLTPSTSYHLQTDSQMECINQEIEAYLQVFMSHRQDDWADWLPLAEFAYNNKVHSATCWTPFELDARQHPHLGVEPMRTSTVEAVDTFARQLGHAQEEAKAALEWVADDMKQYYDQNCQVALEYRVRDKAWLSLQNYSSDCPMKKLDHKWAGPFTITKVISPAAIKLHLSAWEKNIHPSYPSPVSTPTSQTKSWSACNLHNLVLSQLMIKRNTKLKRSLTPGSGGASYGTWLSSLGGHTPIICGSPTLMSMPQQL